MKREKRISLKDVAEAAGVSISLVSIVLNGKAQQYRIADEVAQRVMDIAKKMNYSPNLAARNLRGGKTQLIGLVVTDISNPFYAAIARVVENRANALDYTVIFGSSDEDPEKTRILVELLLNKGVDGLIIVPCDGSEELVRELYAHNVPMVLIDRYFPHLNVSFSCLDNYKATQLATQHLIEQGYTNIGLIGYKTAMNHIADRIKGYKDMMSQAGLEKNIQVKQVNILRPEPEVDKALRAMIHKKKTDAVLFLTNMLTVYGLYALSAMNVKIPETMAVVGFNRNDLFNLFYTPVTYIEQPMELIATEAVNILVEKIKSSNQRMKSMVFFEPELVIKASSLRTKRK